jgi:hypothetical protein
LVFPPPPPSLTATPGAAGPATSAAAPGIAHPRLREEGGKGDPEARRWRLFLAGIFFF